MDTTDMTFKEPGKDLLRFLTCGSVDDGKSTLIGRLLHDSKLVFEDQLMALARDSARHGTTGDDIDFALLVDGLEAEREQGITIDVAYRFFTTPRRSFIVADTPGHEQYTRNMATGASRAELAIILIDARKGISVQTRRHSLICSLLGIRHVVVAINKVDLIAYDEERFGAIASEYCALASELGFSSVFPIPISARYGDNVATISAETGWYKGPSLLEYLETVNVEGTETGDAFRLPVQLVVRPNLDFRGYAGTVIAGKVSPGDSIMVGKSGKSSIVKEVLTYDGPQLLAKVGDAVTITLVDDIDVGRGDLLCSLVSPPEISDQFAAEILWMSEKALMPGRSYLARIGTNMTPITVTAIKHKVDVNTRDHLAAVTLELNEIGLCNLATGAEIAFDRYAENRKTGSFILIDRFTNNTVGAGSEYALAATPGRKA
jgi:bifunctional enzyme CysN/CysC